MDEEENKNNEVLDEKEELVEKSLTERMRGNPWIISTFVLGALFIIIVVMNFTGMGSLTGNVISETSAGENLVAYLNTIAESEVTLIDVTTEGSMYLVSVGYQGETIPIYVTKDGNYYTSSLIPITGGDSGSSSTTQEEIPKTEKPSVELYVFTYCPYGLQMEKAMIPVANLFGDKVDFKIRQIGAMHGEYEKIEAERQLCIEENYPDKFLSYINAFAIDTSIGDCNGDAACLVPKLSALYTQLGIDGKKIDSCITSEGVTMYNAEVQNSQANGVSGSPTTIINGVETSLSRSPDAIKDAVCEAFTTVPSECSQTLSASSASPGFGAGTGTAAASAASC